MTNAYKAQFYSSRGGEGLGLELRDNLTGDFTGWRGAGY